MPEIYIQCSTRPNKNGEGILAFITNNSFIDGITHRQMRKNLLETFDKVYVLDLHGSSMKNETALDGSKDENVFDIMQGVSINIFIKNSRSKNSLADIYHHDLLGLRSDKYSSLSTSNIGDIDWSKLQPKEPYYFFIDKNFEMHDKYLDNFSLKNLFGEHASGFQTKRDKTTIQLSIEELIEVEDAFKNNEVEDIRKSFSLPKDGRDWKIEWAKEDIKSPDKKYIKVMYRPFDDRFTIYTGNSKGFVAYPRQSIYKHLESGNNISLISCRQQSTFDFQHVFVSQIISDMCNISSQTKETGYIFPLYLYPEENTQTELLEDKDESNLSRTPNLNLEIVADIAETIKLTFTNEKEEIAGTFAPIDILDYIYAVLHSPTYRETYKEFLKIDFPRVPYPSDADTFWQLVALGGELRQTHLLESPKLAAQTKALGVGYPVGGDNAVTRKMTKTSVGFEPDEVDSSIGKVWLNDTQYFTNVPLVAWEFYIGGYQPAQKWLKDRQGRTLDISDVRHYMNIIAALSLTHELMQQIDNIKLVG